MYDNIATIKKYICIVANFLEFSTQLNSKQIKDASSTFLTIFTKIIYCKYD